MRKFNCKGKIAFLLAFMMLLGAFPFPNMIVYADEVSTEEVAKGEAHTENADANVGDPDEAEASDVADEDEADEYRSEYSQDQYLTEYDTEYVKKMTDTVSYREYTRYYKDVEKAKETITVYPSESLNEELTTAKTEIVKAEDYDGGVDIYGDTVKGDSLYTGSSGETVIDIDIPETGMYAIRLTYYAKLSDSVSEADDQKIDIPTTVERMLYVDDALPFSEARYFYLPRVWEYEYQYDDDGNIVTASDKKNHIYNTFQKDKNGNDTRPRRNEVGVWQTYYLRDWLGYEIDPLQFYFSEGKHTITLVSNREAMIVNKIELYPYEKEPEYKDWLADMKKKGIEEVTGVDEIRVQAENPVCVSVQNVFPGNDRTSCLTQPQDPAHIKYNILDNGTVNNWMKYSITAPKAGLYKLVFRFRQNSLLGMFTSRRIRINGNVQFREASYLRFMYDTAFQVEQANNGDQEFLFYLDEGENIVELEIVVGEMVQYVYDIEQIIKELNEAYQKMLMITGPIPDSYRNYGFNRIVPECVDTIGKSGKKLKKIKNSIMKMTGQVSDQANTLDTISKLLIEMYDDEEVIAPNFLTFKNYIISLSDWLYAALSQPCKFDYLEFEAVDGKEPQAKANFIQTAFFEVRALFSSFTMDYTTIGFSDDKITQTEHTITMWAISDREAMLILRYIIDHYFTPDTGISLRLKVISAGLQEAILGGVGPDVSFMDPTNTITWGMRTAINPIDQYEGFKEIMTEFPDAFMDLLTMTDPNDENYTMRTYGLPSTLNLNMGFYRIDILNELGLKVPNTWDDLHMMFPTLLNNRLQVGISTAYAGATMFLYQYDDANLYKDEGYAINMDNNTSLTAFKNLCEMFQKYDCPVAYDITRFRTGEIPIMMSNDAITIYNQLMTFYELRGLWQMEPLIGTLRDDGTINRTSICTTQAMIMPRSAKEPEIVWQYMRWYVGEESQKRQARETIAVSAPTTKYSTANVKALLAQKWTDQERASIKEQVENLRAIPEYPGAYIVGNYIQFAFNEAYNNGTDPSEAMLDQIIDINKEISRKRKEFGLDYHEISYGFTVDEPDSTDGDSSASADK